MSASGLPALRAARTDRGRSRASQRAAVRGGAASALPRRARNLLLSGIFVVGGWEAYRSPGGRAAKAAALGVPRPEEATRLNGATMVVAGVALGLGVLPRLAAAILAASLLPTTLAGHPFWKEQEAGARAAQRLQFCKNMGLLAGLIGVLLDRRRPPRTPEAPPGPQRRLLAR